jgi:hypothetical protein
LLTTEDLPYLGACPSGLSGFRRSGILAFRLHDQRAKAKLARHEQHLGAPGLAGAQPAEVFDEERLADGHKLVQIGPNIGGEFEISNCRAAH